MLLGSESTMLPITRNGALFLLTVSSLLACGASDPEPNPLTNGGGGDGGAFEGGFGDGGTNGDASAGAGGVSGQLLERTTRAPMPARALRLRDAKGKVVDLTSDASGGFAATDLATPYDLWIAPSGTTPSSSSQVYLGLTATKIRVFAGDAAVPATPTHTGTMNVTWISPTCTGGSCKVALVARMPDGTEKYFPHPGYGPGPIPKPFVANMTWTGASPSSASLALVLSAPDGASHFFATSTVSLTDGQTLDVTLSPQSVPSLGLASVTAASPPAPPFSAPAARVHLALPAPNGEVEIATGAAVPPLGFSVPNIPGSSLRFYLTDLAGGGAFNSVGAVQIGNAVAATPFSVAQGEPYPIVAPAANGTVSLASGSIDFRASTEPRARFVQLLRSDGPSTFVWLGDPKLVLSRLAGLGPPMTQAAIELAVEEHARPLDEIATDMTVIANDRTSATSYAAVLSP
jgi:hypothetical protein